MDSWTTFAPGEAKQLSLSRTMARMSTFPSLVKALLIGSGICVKLETVACGRQSAGLYKSLKTFNVPETLRFHMAEMDCCEWLVVYNQLTSWQSITQTRNGHCT